LVFILNQVKLTAKIESSYCEDISYKVTKECWDRIYKIAHSAIIDDIPQAMKNLFDINIKTSIVDREEGSVIITFLVYYVYPTYVTISQYENFGKGIRKLKQVCNIVLTHALNLINKENLKVQIKTDKISLIEIETKKNELEENIDDIDCDFNKISEDLVKCARILQSQLSDNGFRPEHGITDLECLKLASELIKICRRPTID
jgi:hypothetical protein